MSANIGTKKLKFAVFGRGFDDTRNNSGEGFVETVDNYALSVRHGAIDETGDYIWFSHPSGLYKCNLEDMSGITQSVYTGSVQTFVGKPSNVVNNYGILLIGDDTFKIFDLTDDTIIQTGTGSGFTDFLNTSSDVILVGDRIYIVKLSPQRADITIAWFDISDGSCSCYVLIYSHSCGGFTDNSSALVTYIPQWFSDYRVVKSLNFSGGSKWELMASESGGGGFPYVDVLGFGGNGKIYFPTYLNSKWRMGEYSAGTAPSIDGTPHPIRTFGKFDSYPDFYWKTNQRYGIAFSEEKKDVAFLTNLGLFRSDFNDIEKLTDEFLIPIAMNEKVIVATSWVYDYIYKFTYR